jgi:hypothetical protein
MAAQHAAQAQANTPADAMGTNRLLGVIGAGRNVPAAALQPEHDFQGRKGNAINVDQKDENRLHEPFSMAQFLKKATAVVRTRSCFIVGWRMPRRRKYSSSDNR